MGIRLAHIAPIFTTQKAINQSGFNMVLAHIAKENEGYCDLFKHSDKPTLLDNGAFEQGYPMPADEMIELGHKVGADILVLPDFPYSDWKIGWRSVEAEIMTYKDAGFKTMFVPQSLSGDVVGLCSSIEKALEHPHIDYIGLSILAVPNAGTDRTSLLHRYSLWSSAKKRFHVLGCLDDPIGEMEEISKLFEPYVNSWDTSAAVWKGLHDKLVMPGDEKFKLSVDFNSPLQWTEATEANVGALNAAIG